MQVLEIDPTGYSSASARSYDSIKLLVKKVYIDSTIWGLGLANCAHWFNAFANCTEVRGFDNLSGIKTATQMFSSYGSLETICATSHADAITSGSSMFYSCNRLVGGTDGFVPSSTSGASVCKLGAGGVLTDPNDDNRTWFWAHFYDDGGGVVTASSTPDKAGSAYLNLNYIFYSCTNLASVTGLGNLSGVRSMRYTFSSCAFATIDFRGFDPSTLTDLFYCFSGCGSLVAILADSTWALPSSGVSGMQCFYNCKKLVGGNGTAWSSSNVNYTYMRIDRAGQAGYLTAA